MKTNKYPFGVKSKYFEVYQAYKTIVEEIGYVYNEKFSAFTRSKAEMLHGLWLDANWDQLGPNILGFSFTGFGKGNKTFNLDTQFEEAVEYAKDVYKEYYTQHVFEQILSGDYKMVDIESFLFILNGNIIVELVCKNYAKEKDLMFCYKEGNRRGGLLVVGKYNENE